MDIHPVIRSQYLAALEMLKLSIVNCPEAMWDDPADRNPFWYVAYHGLFFTHVYLQDEESFEPRPGLPDDREDIRGAVVSRADILAYLGYCQMLVNERVPQMDLDGPSGFKRKKFSKLELQIYSIRHIQQHTGELMERLGARTQVEFDDWVSVAPE